MSTETKTKSDESYETELRALRSQRAVILGQQTKAKNFLATNLNSLNRFQVETKLQMLETQNINFEKVQSQIERLDEEELTSGKRDAFEETYYTLRSDMLQHLDTFLAPNSTIAPNNVTISHKSRVNLQKLALPSFSGSYTKWMDFSDMFNSLIHNNKELTNIEKFQYLRSCIHGDAARVIESLECTSQNYETAIELLKCRYDNKRFLFQAHIQEIFQLHSIVKPTVETIRGMIDTINVNLRALNSIGTTEHISDGFLLHLILSKFDNESQAKWEDEISARQEQKTLSKLTQNLDSTTLTNSDAFEFPSWNDLCRFMERRCKTLNIIEAKSHRSSTSANTSQSHQRSQQSQSHHLAKSRTQESLFKNSSLLTTNPPSTSPCVFCNQPSHNPFSCQKFVNLSPMDRFKLTKELKLCLNCLRGRHTVQHCNSANKCQKCGDSHHTLLHRERIAPAIPQTPAPSATDSQEIANPNPNPLPSTSSTSLQASHADNINRDAGYVLLATALVNLSNGGGTSLIGRTLLDSCSQLNFITEHIAQHLKLSRSRTYLDVSGIGQVSTIAYQRAQLCVSSLNNSFKIYLDVIILPEITSPQPSRHINIKNWKIPSNTWLSDPRFNQPGAIDCLIGAGIYFDLLQVGQIKLGENLPSLQKTSLGWIVGGTIRNDQEYTPLLDIAPVGPKSSSINYTCFTTTTTPSIEELLQQFWTIENNHISTKKLSIEEEECETFFKSTTTRCPLTNKFIVQLPFREDRTSLGSSYEIAKKRLVSIEHKIYRSLPLQRDYCHFIDEYARLDHMCKLDAGKAIQDNVNYIPHHCVLKPDSSTTKLRVVFDASCKTSSGKSLNDILKVGPTLQDDIFTILVRFRTHRFVLMADITQMYRQILVSPKDTNTQCILWRNYKTKAIESYMLKTVTYGTSCAPYLAVRCLRLLAEEGAQQFPIGSAITLRDFYVDNLMSGANDRSEVIQIKEETTNLLLSAGFHLRKWASNDPTIIANVPEEDKESFIVLGDSEVIKALGMGWDPKEDTFRFSYIESPSHKSNKRSILSQISQFYDPLGLMNPFIVKAKIFMQTLWKLKLHWDESLPEDLHTQWLEYRNHLNDINQIKIPRYVSTCNINTQIHGFSDASTKAYGACVYLRTIDEDGVVSSNLVCAKSRVAPIAETTIPRLELCAALLLVELLDRVISILGQHIQTYCWTDSTIVLAWLASEPCRWTTFVSNRVAKIQNFPHFTWNYIPTSDNPADLVSRGVFPHELIGNKFWFQGPNLLRLSEQDWPKLHNKPEEEEITEQHINNRVFKKTKPKISGPITALEFDETLRCLLCTIQHNTFAEEINNLKKGKPLKSSIQQLSPFIKNGLVRVGGRISNSTLPYDAMHPILLPKSHPFIYTLIRHHYYINKHAGPQTLHNILRQRFWILDVKSTVRGVVHRCYMCYRNKPVLAQQIMGNLPCERVTPSRPFSITGLDYCGPLYVSHRIRGRAPYKTYLAIFVCFSTKAVHLELVSDLSTSSFILALKRFIARRGKCMKIYSDNATNFTGAHRELRELHTLFMSEQHNEIIRQECLQDGIEWSFIPPRSPNFGGLWEAAVKVAKHHLRRIIGQAVLSFEEMTTVCCQIEAVMNSRPLTPMSSNPNDLTALTPGHFLVGSPLTSIAEPRIEACNISNLKRYQFLQWIQQNFWRRWSHDYLQQLQLRKQWNSAQLNIHINELVLLKEDNTPPLKWPMGRIVEIYTGDDGNIRVANVKTATGIYKRAISKLCPIPIEFDPENTSKGT
ncbi:uncharacterized protein LOC129941403 [Eupeodes corollae]|uniref:uncharacterized protein LOC129941403 n=1 Tax=Eupeodes corollae TaxID=290404 RepID=UPI00248F5A94|nr:uncharacterized protein LOC129941403 [Eupeodes corollae]